LAFLRLHQVMGSTQQAPIALATERPGSIASGFRTFWIAIGFLIICFSRVLFDLANHALKESLHSHIILVPFICAYLVWQFRGSLPPPRRSGFILPGIFAFVGTLSIAAYATLRSSGRVPSHNDYLSLLVFSFCMFVFAIAAFFLGTTFIRRIAFPLFFLLVLVPLPDAATAAIEIASQYASAETYSWFMNLSGATYYREGRTFVLPNLTIVVAQECSGIRSSLVLFITSLIAGHLFLRSPWKKAILALAVFPLGILRNAFRIYFLSMASAHWDPNIINSPLHHRGGPIFFALSLIPFFLLLLWLKKSENRNSPVISKS
jgi:exosortase C (VPDSG-CTERM-specific)